MSRFILTGAPDAGKTTLIRHFEGLGHFVVEDAASDIIRVSQANGVNEPRADPSFIEELLALQSEQLGSQGRSFVHEAAADWRLSVD